MSYQLTQQHIAPTQIYLNSKYADMYGGEPSFRSWCYFVFHEPVVKVPSGYKYLISLNNAEIPNSFYNVNSMNNTFIIDAFFANGFKQILATVTIPPGNYSCDEIENLLSNIQCQYIYYDSQDATQFIYFTLTAIYDINLNKFKFTVSDCDNASAARFSTFNAKIGITTPEDRPLPLFGFSGKANSLTSDATIQNGTFFYSDACVDVTGTRSVFFRLMNVHTAGFDSKAKISTNILGRIPMACEPFNILYWQNITHFKTIAQTKNLNVIEIQITDSDGNLIDFNGCDWSASIEINVLGSSSEPYKADGVDAWLL
jgi:hypothetical protein